MKNLTKSDLSKIYKVIITTLKACENDPDMCWDDFRNNTPACEMVLAIYYWKLMPVNKNLLKVCLSTNDCQWDKFYNYCADIWQKNAEKEAKMIIKQVEKGLL